MATCLLPGSLPATKVAALCNVTFGSFWNPVGAMITQQSVVAVLTVVALAASASADSTTCRVELVEDTDTGCASNLAESSPTCCAADQIRCCDG